MSIPADPQWVKLALDLTTFDPRRFGAYVARARREGIRLTTFDELTDTPAHRRTLYELNRTCSADIPERGAFHTFDEYLARRFDTPSHDPRGIVIALDGDTWVGMAATSHHDGHLFNEMTGVLSGYRGRGLSIAMKTIGTRFAGLYGVHRIRTVHHPANTNAIAMNRKMGYVDADWPDP
ncbi:GNAT family N-acetyltransferase [Streptomyces sp. NPDC001568]|uniref:GNAT family N-acetyltransferase n=1 Tax=Streptomyces sp. NPDC001568 TaxID=3364588 RepID=UPI0036947E72